MTKQAHTAGPWTRGDAYDCGKGYAICSGYAVVARVVGNGYPVGIGAHPESDANASLIALAPEMAEVLRRLVGIRAPNSGVWTKNEVERSLAALEIEVRAILAKLDGDA